MNFYFGVDDLRKIRTTNAVIRIKEIPRKVKEVINLFFQEILGWNLWYIIESAKILINGMIKSRKEVLTRMLLVNPWRLLYSVIRDKGK